jgi:glycosyltransferase involved in cell wall biosynthesis
MKYTFLVPAYKRRYFKEAVSSMLSQSFDDYQIVISDDCSPEGLAELAEELQAEADGGRIVYHRNQENIGGLRLVNHWNQLVEQCKSDFFVMASDDDVYNPDFLAEVDRLVSKYPEVDVVRARAQMINDAGEPTAREDIFDECQTELEAVNAIFCSRYIGCIGNYVFRTSALKQAGGFVYQPYAWFSDLLTVTNLLYKGQANTKDVLFSFRLSGENISSTAKNKRMDRMKLAATIGYDEWMSNFSQKMRFQTTALNQRLYDEFVTAFKHRAYSQCGDYSWALPFYEWPRIYKALSGHKVFSKASFLKYFSIAVLNRKLGSCI